MKVVEVAMRPTAWPHRYPVDGAEVGELVQQPLTLAQLGLGVAVEGVGFRALGDQTQVVVDLGVGGR